MSTTAYLRRTSTRGNYSYRRPVSPDLRDLWGKREEKVSLKTKSHPEALRRAAAVNTKFDEKAARLREQLSGNKPSNLQVMNEAKEILIKEGIHPQQIPKTKEAALKFFEAQANWKELYAEIMPDVTEHNSYNASGNIHTYRETDESSPFNQAYKIINGQEGLSIAPTLQEATEYYLKINAEEKQRPPHSQKKHEAATYRAIKLLGPLDTPITEFNRRTARKHKDALAAANPTWADETLHRGMKILSAIFRSAILEYELSMANPWLSLTGSMKKNRDGLTSEDRGNKRRPMTPDEITAYKGHLIHPNINPQASLVGQLMIQTGCRNMEAGGLLIRDLKFDTNVPYMQFRFNRFRSLKNRNSVRDVPVVGDLLNELRGYASSIDTSDPDSPLFPRFVKSDGSNKLSEILRNIVNLEMGLAEDRTCVPYSTRHSMKDKLRTLKTPLELQYAILGNGKWTVGEDYGDGNPLAYLQREIIKAEKLESWGNH